MLFVKLALCYWFVLYGKVIVIAVGYAISLGVGQCLIDFITNKWIEPASKRAFQKRFGENSLYTKEENLSWLLGICERTLYTTVVALGFQEFIIYWLVAKVGASWVYAKNKGHTPLDFNRFMIGNALSIIFGGLGGLIIRYLFIK